MTEGLAMVTGGSGSIGSAICRALVADGFRVVSLDRVAPRDADVPYVAVDLASADDVRRASREVLDAHRGVDVLVHAAAAFDQFALAQLDLDVYRHVQAVNVESFLVLAHELGAGMVERGHGRIVAVVSDTVFAPPSGALLPYVASKGALIALVRSLAVDLGPDGVSVAAVAPGLTPTPAALAGVSPEAFDDVVRRQALARALTPDDVAHAVAFLAGPGGAALTGQVLCTDGGLVMR
jgi:3-oxoacyl-[acyl-carrier protein] reductase